MRARPNPRRSSRPARRPVRRPLDGRAVVQPFEQRIMMSAGSLDPSWNGAGLLSIAPPSGASAQTTVFGVQPDERVVVGQVYTNGTTSFTVVSRLTAQGAADPTFTPVTLGFTASGLIVEPSGKILVSGPDIESINGDGSIDTSFGGGTGFITTPFPLAGITAAGTGAIYADGTTSAGAMEVVRYLPTGAVDTTYGTAGTSTITVTGGGAATYTDGPITLDASGRILVGLAVNGNAALATFGAVRLTTAGAMDPAYGIGGVAEVKGYGQPSHTGGITVAPSGVLYQAGTYNYGSASGTGYLIVYAPDGQAAFISPTPGLDTFAQGVAVGADSKPIITGTAVQGSGATTHTVIAVDRLLSVDWTNPVFAPDTTFGGTGLVTVAYQGGSSADTASVGDVGFGGFEMPNGNVVIGGVSVNPGTSVSTFNVTRLVGDASFAAGVGTITGVVFFDDNRDGVQQAGDEGLANFGVFLDANDNGVYDAGEQTALTDSTGRYTFNGIVPSGTHTYHVVQGLPAGFTHTAPGTSAAASISVSLTSAATVGASFGVTGTDSISGVFFVDTNHNGVQDNGETGVAGNTVYLDLDQSGGLTAADETFTTTSSGAFTFSYLAPTTYIVRALFSTGLAATTTYPLTVTLVGNVSQSGKLIGET